MILRNTLYNLIGLGAPLLVAVVAIPELIEALGLSRFGLLTLIWAVVSYFGLFDFGLGRALTQQMAVAIGAKQHAQLGPLVATSLWILGALGVVAGLVMASLAGWGVGLVDDVPDSAEAVRAVWGMALAMPAIVLTAGFRGMLEAQQAFATVNAIRLPMGIYTFLAPLGVVVLLGPRLDAIALVLAMGRIAFCAAHAWFAFKRLPHDRGRLSFRRELVRPLAVRGGWMTVSNIVSPFMGYADRFVIGAVVSAAAVAYYTTPYELITKLWILPGALTTALFPTLANSMAKTDGRARTMAVHALKGLFAILLPVTLAIALFANELLTLWIDASFATHSSLLLQIFSAGILINCMAHVPLALIHSAGAPKRAALVHLAELPAFMLVLWLCTSRFGLLGGVIAWFARMTADTILMFAVSGRLPSGTLMWRKQGGTTLTALALALVGYMGVAMESVTLRLLWLAGISIAVVLWLRAVGGLSRDHSSASQVA